MTHQLIAHVFDPWGHMGDGWSWAAMTLMIVVFIALIIWTVTSTRSTPSERQPNALEILEQRYARGEIDDEEFRIRREVLTGKGQKP